MLKKERKGTNLKEKKKILLAQIQKDGKEVKMDENPENAQRPFSRCVVTKTRRTFATFAEIRTVAEIPRSRDCRADKCVRWGEGEKGGRVRNE